METNYHTPAVKEELNFLAELRKRTAEQHESLEANPYSQDIMKGTITKKDYIHFLKKFYGYYKPVENIAYLAGKTQVPDIEQRKRAHLIPVDLKTLGDNTSQEDIPLCYDLPELKTGNQLLGSIYVLEGSVLGGQVISRKVSSALGLPLGQGTAFYLGHGKDTGAMWKQFLDHLRSYTSAHPEATDEIIITAQDTFSTIQAWLEK